MAENDLNVPPKAPKGNQLREVRRAELETNAFRLRFNQMRKVFQHEVTIYGEFVRQGVPKDVDLVRAAKNDAQRQERRVMVWDIFQKLMSTHTELFGTDDKRYAYDCGFLLFALDQLAPSGEPRELLINTSALSPESQQRLGPNCERIKVKLTFTTALESDPKALSGGGDADTLEQRCRALQQFCDILTNQEVNQRADQLIYKNKRYDRNSHDAPAHMAKVIKEGSEKTTAIVGNSVDQQGALIVIEPKTSPFFKPGPLKDIFRELQDEVPHNNARNFRNVLNQQLRGVIVQTTHRSKNITFPIKGVTEQLARDLVFPKEEKGIHITDYFRDQYSIDINPKYPCVVAERIFNGRKQTHYFPCDVLQVMAGQRVQTEKQTPKLVEQLIDKARRLPPKVKEDVLHEMTNLGLSGKNAYLNAFGVSIDTALLPVTGQVLPPPTIKYSQGTEVTDQRAGYRQWKLGSQRFVRPAKDPAIWVVCVFANAVTCTTARDFTQVFIRTGEKHGMKLGEPVYDRLQDVTAEKIEEKCAYYSANSVNFVIFLHGGEKRSMERDLMKEAETRYNFVTQMVHTKTVLKALSDKGAWMVLDNIIMKTNLKLGGLNHMLVSNRCHPNGYVEESLFPTGRMFIGLDLQSPGSPLMGDADESSGDPTVVGVCYSLASPSDMRGGYWYQEARERHITGLQDVMRRVLEHYRTKNSSDNRRPPTYPKEIVIFRAGVSEGEMLNIIKEEIPQIQKAFKEMPREGGRPYNPRLVVILAQKQCGLRMLPKRIDTRARPPEQNVEPGTCVSTDIVNPLFTEYILVSQQALMGTAKPTRYIVVHDDPARRFTSELLENMTHSLCYLHGIVTLPISRPAPLYAATELVKRGRANWKARAVRTAGTVGSVSPASSSPASASSRTAPTSAELFEFLNNQRLITLPIRLDQKFWA